MKVHQVTPESIKAIRQAMELQLPSKHVAALSDSEVIILAAAYLIIAK